MILSRAKPAIPAADPENQAPNSATTKQLPKLEDFLSRRDYIGALSLLEFHRNSGKGGDMVDSWLGYCAFHAGDYKRSMLEYDALSKMKKPPKVMLITQWRN